MSTVPPSGPAPAWCLWRNPILRRYLRTRLRPRGLGASLIIVLIIAGFIFALVRINGINQAERMLQMAEKNPNIRDYIPTMKGIERACLIPLMVFQGIILFIFGTGQVAGGMTADADEGTMDYMRLSPMTPLSKVLGYLFGLPVREWILFAATLPFTAWAIWKGEVPSNCWIPVYAVFITSAVLYHLTGLTAGTVLRNRRWAFLLSMGGVFLLYTLVPQLAKFGLVYFEYLTIWPVLTENMHGFAPETLGSIMKAINTLEPEVGFFNLGFPEAVFTIVSQLILCVTFVVMLWRRWRRAESHLMGKVWATGFFAWIQIVLLGCSQPLIGSGMLFISQRFSAPFRNMRGLKLENIRPQLGEAIAMVAIYGTVTLLAMLVLALLIAPGRETQARGARRMVKLGFKRIPLFSDESTSLLFVAIMALIGGAGWTIFANLLIGSHWFPGQFLPPWTFLVFTLVLFTVGICCVLVYELWGAKGLFLSGVFGGLVPFLAGIIVFSAAGHVSTTTTWITAASPLMSPTNAVATVMPDGLGVQRALRLAGPRAFAFWQGLLVITTVWLFIKHRARPRLAPITIAALPKADSQS